MKYKVTGWYEVSEIATWINDTDCVELVSRQYLSSVLPPVLVVEVFGSAESLLLMKYGKFILPMKEV